MHVKTKIEENDPGILFHNNYFDVQKLFDRDNFICYIIDQTTGKPLLLDFTSSHI